jgi:transcriptional regulator with XRE-family HTH domain
MTTGQVWRNNDTGATPGVIFSCHFLTDGQGVTLALMESKKLLAGNLRALMAYAADTKSGPDSLKRLSRETGLSRATLRAILTETASPAADTLAMIARAYGLETWQLLFPHLDPANPPVVPVTETEKELTRRLQAVSKAFREQIERIPESPPRRARDDHPVPAQGPHRRRKDD